MSSNLTCSFKKEFLKEATILYVEDKEDIRTEAFEIFHGFFKSVIVAVDGEDALNKFLKYQKEIDIVLTNVEMPNMDGLQLLEQIREKDWTIPVLISTAFQESDTLLKLIKFNVTNYIAKPIQLNTTFKIISLLMEEIQRKKDIKRKENELRQFMSILDSLNLVSEINTDGTISYGNDLYLAKTGYGLDELSKINHKIINKTDNNCIQTNNAHKLIKNGHIWSGERKEIDKDGKIYYTFAVILPIFDNSGNIQKYVEFATLTTKYKSEILKLRKHIMAIKSNNFQENLQNKDKELEHSQLATKYKNKELLYMELTQKHQRRIDENVENAQQVLFELDKSKKRIVDLEEKLKEQEKRFDDYQSVHNGKVEVEAI